MTPSNPQPGVYVPTRYIGETDDTIALRRAIDSAIAFGQTPGGKPTDAKAWGVQYAGEVLIDRTLEVSGPIYIRPPKGRIAVDGLVVRGVGGTGGIKVTGGDKQMSLFTLDYCRNCTFERVGVEVSSPINIVWDVNAGALSKNNRWNNCHIDGGSYAHGAEYQTAWKFGDALNEANNDFHSLTGCSALGYSMYGADIWSTQCYGITFDGCVFNGTKSGAVNAVRLRGGSFIWRGGHTGGHTGGNLLPMTFGAAGAVWNVGAAFALGGSHSGAHISDVRTEDDRFLVSYGMTKRAPVLLERCDIGGGPADGYSIIFKQAGPLNMTSCHFHHTRPDNTPHRVFVRCQGDKEAPCMATIGCTFEDTRKERAVVLADNVVWVSVSDFFKADA